MSNFLIPFSPEYSLQIPDQVSVWMGWGVWLVFLIFSAVRMQQKPIKLDRKSLVWFAGLSVSILIFTPFLGTAVNLDLPIVSDGRLFQYMMSLAAVPWLIAGGILGPLPAIMLAGISGLLYAFLGSTHIFTPLIFMTLALLFSWAVRQCYRPLFYRVLRFPLVAATFSLITSIPTLLLAQILSQQGSLAERFAAAFLLFPSDFLTVTGMVLIGGLVCLGIKLIVGKVWEVCPEQVLSPTETHFPIHWITVALPIMLIIWAAATFTSWKIAERNARRELASELAYSADRISGDLQLFLEVGKGLILESANDPDLTTGLIGLSPENFRRQSTLMAFFDRIALFDKNGVFQTAYPSSVLNEKDLFSGSSSNTAGWIGEDQTGVSILVFRSGDAQPMIEFIANTYNPSGQRNGFLIGQVDIQEHPFLSDVILEFQKIASYGSGGKIITKDGEVLYQNVLDDRLEPGPINFYNSPIYFEEPSLNGTLLILFFQPISDTEFGVVLGAPAFGIYQAAWHTALPIFFTGLVFTLFVCSMLWLVWLRIGKDLQELSAVVNHVAEGDLNINLGKSNQKGALNTLRSDIEKMVSALQAKTRNQSDLFFVDKESTNNLELIPALNIIMKAALSHKVSAVRIVLTDSNGIKIVSETEQRFSKGKHGYLFAPLDREILAKVEAEGEIVLGDFHVGKTFSLGKGMPYPASLIAQPLKWENQALGILYVTFQDLKSPDQNEINYFRTLAQKTSKLIAHYGQYEEFKRWQDQFRNILDTHIDPILLISSENLVVYANAASENLFGRSRDLLLGRSILIHIDNEELIGFINEKANEQRTTEIVFSDGKVFKVSLNSIPSGLQGELQVLNFHDITQNREKDAIKSEYVTTVSHELRSPLTLIQGYAKILRLTGNLSEQQNDYVNNIIQVVEEMKNLVQNLLDIGRLESGDPLNITRVQVDEVLRKVVESLTNQAKQKNIQLSVELPQKNLIIEADIPFITQAIKNLLDNAIKFSKMGEAVVLSVQVNDKDIIFSVQDAGPGIAPLDQNHIFDKFKRVITSRDEQSQGSGLGLAIVKSIAEHHNGKVWLESQLGKGSTFYIQIPRFSNIR
jgi:PAS domain S-box-containing protein